MKVVGITGGIGSGKSTVAQVFKTLGVPVYLSDARAKALYAEDPTLREAIIQRFGEDAYLGQQVNRSVLAEAVFNDPEALKDLNALIHPRVAQDFLEWQSRQSTPYVLKEAAILIETGGHTTCDAVLLISAPESLRISRVMARDGVEASAVHARMKHQWTDAERLPHVTHQLHNDDSALLTPQIEALHAVWMEG